LHFLLGLGSRKLFSEFPEKNWTRWVLKAKFVRFDFKIIFDYMGERLVVILNIQILQGGVMTRLW